MADEPPTAASTMEMVDVDTGATSGADLEVDEGNGVQFLEANPLETCNS
eukprot:CAMPEP_0172452870 /NCGR_PEP_ID=MMETSP1065-20121228/10405_1 /TAXON_ID=265537 /ORGANISM="Amphiprora paludosa, Strain CCMP125" /LENGTH=48 /DNA_ID= /DNA_START= /DNA_END= /DNA_ORIENTATION=